MGWGSFFCSASVVQRSSLGMTTHVGRDPARWPPGPGWLLVLSASLALLQGMMPGFAVGQRGRDQRLLEPAPRTATTGFPGIFDTNVPGAGDVTLSLPSLQLDVGVTERWSIGVNGFFSGLAAAQESIGLVARTRYRVFHSPAASLTLDGLGLMYRAEALANGPSGSTIEGAALQYGGLISTNFAWRFAPQHALQATLGFVGIRQQESFDNSILEADDFLGGWAFALGYQYSLNDTWAFQLTLASAPTFSQITDSSQAFGILDLSGSEGWKRSMVRGMVYFRPSQTWLFEAGIYYIPEAVSFPLPWLGASVRFE